jgi:N-acetyl-anhydromuramyl-L-alanine amidase AmpD
MAMRTLSPEELSSFEGILGHYHVTARKQDPGPAFHWDRVLRDARALLTTSGRQR